MTNGITLEEILEHANLSKALSRVEANRGAPGVDRMGTGKQLSTKVESFIVTC